MQLPIRLAVCRRHPLAWLLSRGNVVAVTLLADGHLMVERSDGSSAAAIVHPQTTVFSWLVVLLWRVDNRLESLALPRVAMAAESHRQLRLWLRWRAKVG